MRPTAGGPTAPTNQPLNRALSAKMEPINDIQGKRFGPVGTCIYCGSGGDENGLRDEHIIPYSLGGKSVLLEASCRKCEAVTSYLDGYLARQTFGPLRVATRTQTRGKHPSSMPVRLKIAEEQTDITLPSEKFPFFTHMPVWGLPGILRAIQPTAEFTSVKSHMYWYVPDEFRKDIGVSDGQGLQVIDTSKMPNPATFARAIAKIAYCNAVAILGWKSFRPLCIPELILGRYTNIPYFVGAPLGDPPPPLPRGRLHSVELRLFTRERLKLIVCNIRIFAHNGTDQNGMPIYSVVVGAPPPDGVEL